MTDRLPSLGLLQAEVRAERELVLRHSDALDAKAGIVLGFAGAIVAVSATRVDAFLIPGAIGALYAAVQCLVIFEPSRRPILNLPHLREKFLRSESVFTQLNLLDAQIAMLGELTRVQQSNERRLRRALVALGVAIALMIAGTLVSVIGG